MVVARPPAETGKLDDFRAYLDEIMAGALPVQATPASGSAHTDDPLASDCNSQPPPPPVKVSYRPTIRQLPVGERPRNGCASTAHVI